MSILPNSILPAPNRILTVVCDRDYDAGEKWCKYLLSMTGFSSIYCNEPSSATNSATELLSSDNNSNNLKVLESSAHAHFERLLEAGSLETGFSRDALDSLLRNMYVRFIKRQSPYVRNKVKSLVESIISSCNGEKTSKSILQIACTVKYSPYLLCRMIVEALVSSVEGVTTRKAGITLIMRDPDILLIPDKVKILTPEEFFKIHKSIPFRENNLMDQLHSMVRDAVEVDPFSGPQHELDRRELGAQFERKLEKILLEVGTNLFIIYSIIVTHNL